MLTSNPLIPKILALVTRLTNSSQLQRKLLVGGMWATIGKITLTGSGLLLNIILTRLLTPAEVGSYFIVISILYVVSVFVMFGLNQTIVRLISESLAKDHPGRARQAIQLAFTLLLFSSILGIGFMLLGGGQWITQNIFKSPLLSEMITLITIWMVLSTFQSLFAETFRGFQDFRLAAIFGGGSALTRLLLVITLSIVWLIQEHSDMQQIILLSIIVNVITISLATTLFRKQISKLPSSKNDINIREVATITVPLWINAISMLILSQADIWILGNSQYSNQVAIYGVVLRLTMLASTPLLIINAVTPPLIAEFSAKTEYKKLEKILRAISTVISLPSIAVWLIFLILGKFILATLFGIYYENGYFALVILGFSQVINVYVGSCGLTLMMSGHQNTIMRITVIVGIFNLSLMYLLTPILGFQGTAIAFTFTTIVQNLVVLFFSRRKTGIWTHANFRLLLRPKELWEAIQ